MIKAFVSHKTDNWSTPKELYNLFKVHGFYDPCPLDPNGCTAFFDEWKEYNFVNPPYSDIRRFVNKGLVEFEKGHKSVFLVPARVSSQWFMDIVKFGCQVIFIRGRLTFGDSKNSAPFDSCIIVLTGGNSYMSVVKRSDLINYLQENYFCSSS